jgi:hypothetical protein
MPTAPQRVYSSGVAINTVAPFVVEGYRSELMNIQVCVRVVSGVLSRVKMLYMMQYSQINSTALIQY